MISFKTAEEIELMRLSAQLVSKTLAEVAKKIEPGVTTLELDHLAEEFIRDNGGIPGFKGYGDFPNTLCTSPNAQVVHGIPNKEPLKDGDILSVDCGVILNEFYGDTAYTFEVGEVDADTKALLKTTKESLFLGIEKATTAFRVGDIAYAIQQHCEAAGYSVVRELVGHGLGKGLHEKPEVPNYGKRGSGPKLKEGMVICIEPMINMGKRNIYQLEDGWSVLTIDHKPSAHFELTVAIGKEPDVLSTFEYLEKELNN